MPRNERAPGAPGTFTDSHFFIPALHPAVLRYSTEVKDYLNERGDRLNARSLLLVCSRVAMVKRDAFEQLLRNANRDYAPDPKAARYPSVEESTTQMVADGEAYGYKDLCADWYASGDIAPKTRKSWEGKLRLLTAFLGRDDVASITQGDVIRWRDHRQGQGISARTISYADMAGPRAIINWAIGSKKYPRLASNPFSDMAVKVRKKAQTREKGFRLADAEKILAAALEPTSEKFSEAGAGARRWAAWLAAYSGARIGEIAQLHSSNVVEEKAQDGTTIWCMRLTPEDGTIKSKTFRIVPLHPHVLEQGFLLYVDKRRGKPLFYDPERAREADPANTQADKVGQRLGVWVRSLGIEGVAPNHGWRHRLKSVVRSARIDRDVHNYLTGHGAEDVAADWYRCSYSLRHKRCQVTWSRSFSARMRHANRSRWCAGSSISTSHYGSSTCFGPEALLAATSASPSYRKHR
ncbi:MAG: hypothetical protein J7557_15640 [Devosia sp.]|nr:hypothetical protein [Devosia sp.]MBO9590119.1 hypothetical protein [Devosia sp.]